MTETHAKPLPSDDLDAIVTQARESFLALRGARLFITGGTGFFGHWLLESLLHADRELQLGVQVTLLTRNAAHFREASPWIASNTAITLLEGDVRSFAFPAANFTHVLHAATSSAAPQDELALAEEIVTGTQRVLAFAAQAGAQRVLYVSSGAVYGRDITEAAPIAETHLLAADGNPYDEAKRAAERLCMEAVGVQSVIARCFAFVGPRLPLDAHFAIGNFIADALAGRPIRIRGDGTPLRSFLYMSDLAVWLWTLLVRGQAARVYNVGSDEPHSITEAAQLAAQTLAPGLPVEIAQKPTPGAAPNRYIPSIDRARTELGLRVSAPLADALRKTAAWYRS